MKKSYHDSKLRPPRDLIDEGVGERIRSFRVLRGLSMRDVAALGGPCVATQQLAESGLVSVNVNTLRKLAEVLKVRIEEFLLTENSDIEAIVSQVYKMTDEQLKSLLSELKRKVVN